MKKSLTLIFLFIYSNFTFSYGSVPGGKVVDVRIDRDGRGIVKFDRLIALEPAVCSSADYNSHFSFDTTTDGGKAIYSLALTALASGKSIYAIGTGVCNDYSVVEGLSYWHLLDR